MPRFTLSTLVALAIALSEVYAQDNSTTTTSSLVPLASKHFDYNNLVRLFPAIALCMASNSCWFHSHTKLTQTTAFVAPNSVTTGAIRPRKTNSRSAKPPSSTRSTVILVSLVLLTIFSRSSNYF